MIRGTTMALRAAGPCGLRATSITLGRIRVNGALARACATQVAALHSGTPLRAEEGGASGRKYHWIDAEAQVLIARAYARHKALADTGTSFPPALSVKDLEAIGEPYHYAPKTAGDKVALGVTNVLEKFMSLFFRTKYDHHAVTLETVAAVPGMVAAASRHRRSLLSMERDHGWVGPAFEEAENERMHLLIWMQHTKPSNAERAFVFVAQVAYTLLYGTMYAVSPRTAHRAVGYLEEAAHRAYTEYLQAIDSGAIANVPAGGFARKYYHLPDDAKLRDIVLHVRADECMHRDYNHLLADQLQEEGGIDKLPVTMEEDLKQHNLRQKSEKA